MPHFDEIYLALARTSNRYDDDYVIIKGNNQTINILENSDLSITFSFDYYLFNDSGKLYIDGKEVQKDKYSVSKGSTIITISISYLNTLQVGEHSIVATLGDKEVKGNFNIIKVSKKNPKTSDNIIFYISMLGLSLISLIGTLLYKKRF